MASLQFTCFHNGISRAGTVFKAIRCFRDPHPEKFRQAFGLRKKADKVCPATREPFEQGSRQTTYVSFNKKDRESL